MPSRSASGVPTLSRRVLNRTLLARQHLLDRVDRPPLEVVDHLVGLQAQEPMDPYIGLWSRIRDFDAMTLSETLADRRAVRIGLMRTTLHLVSTEDALGLWSVMDPVLRRAFASTAFDKALAGADTAAIIEVAREAVEATPTTPTDLGRMLAERWPGRDPQSLSLVARYHLPLVQVPPRGLWRQTGRATNTTLQAWVGREPDAFAVEDVVVRYLRAFGPASASDIRTWSWLTGLREVIARLRPTMRTYRDERGRELLDVEDGTLVDEDVPAPIRFLPQYDNVFLSHDDRSRINGDLPWGLDFNYKGSILVDGMISGTWRHRKADKPPSITIELGPSVTRAQRDEVVAEGERLATFLAPVPPPKVIVTRAER